MTTIVNSIEAIKEHLENLSDSELVSAHNRYCQNNSYSDDEIFSNDEEFFNTYFESDPYKAVRAAHYGDFHYNHDWVKFNGYYNLETTNSPIDFIDLTAISKDVIENPSDYNIELDEIEEEQENN